MKPLTHFYPSHITNLVRLLIHSLPDKKNNISIRVRTSLIQAVKEGFSSAQIKLTKCFSSRGCGFGSLRGTGSHPLCCPPGLTSELQIKLVGQRPSETWMFVFNYSLPHSRPTILALPWLRFYTAFPGMSGHRNKHSLTPTQLTRQLTRVLLCQWSSG